MQLEVISKEPGGSARPAPLLFVHGAWHGAWCWNVHFLDYFAKHNYSTHALSLRGHGKSEGRKKLRWSRLTHYVEDVAQVARSLPQPPVLIGHSMGGGIVQKYLEQYPSAGAVLLASMPPGGVLATTLRIARRHPREFAKVNLTLSLYPLVATPELARETLFSANLPDDQVQTFTAQLQDESYLGFLDMLGLNLPRPQRIKNIPLLILGAALDTIFLPSQIEATALAYNTKATIFDGIGHDMMLDVGWERVADHILGWLDEQGL